MLDNTALRKAIKKNGFTQQEIAEELGVSTSAISDWVNGKAQPNQKSIEALAKVLEVSPEDITTEQPQAINYGDHGAIFITCDQVVNIYGDKIASEAILKHLGSKLSIDISPEVANLIRENGVEDVNEFLKKVLEKNKGK